jgi:2,7-dihydroxy-5-methyl-1-naphthoate 7-O-methyltransferase
VVEPGIDIGALADLATPWCLRVVVTLGLPEHIASGVVAVADLAAVTGSDEEVLWDVLGHLVGSGVFEEPSPGRFALNDAARALLDPSVRLSLDLNGVGGRFARVWETLPSYVATGRPAYHERFGVGFWDDLSAHPAMTASFDAFMAAAHTGPDQVPPITGSWDDIRTVVDVGGGLGHVLTEILRLHPHVKGTLVDLPGTAERATAALAEAGVIGRVRVVGQSFFDPLPKGGDLYLLSRVLNDWPDPDKEKILRRCAEACPPAGRIVTWGGVRAGPAGRSVQVDKVLCGGRDTDLADFRALANRAGLRILAVHEVTGRIAVECQPGLRG